MPAHEGQVPPKIVQGLMGVAMVGSEFEEIAKRLSMMIERITGGPPTPPTPATAVLTREAMLTGGTVNMVNDVHNCLSGKLGNIRNLLDQVEEYI